VSATGVFRPMIVTTAFLVAVSYWSLALTRPASTTSLGGKIHWRKIVASGALTFAGGGRIHIRLSSAGLGETAPRVHTQAAGSPPSHTARSPRIVPLLVRGVLLAGPIPRCAKAENAHQASQPVSHGRLWRPTRRPRFRHPARRMASGESTPFFARTRQRTRSKHSPAACAPARARRGGLVVGPWPTPRPERKVRTASGSRGNAAKR
jgi:hypothetical protein